MWTLDLYEFEDKDIKNGIQLQYMIKSADSLVGVEKQFELFYLMSATYPSPDLKSSSFSTPK